MTQDVLVVELILSLSHATAIIKKLNQKKHRSASYFFELNELGVNIWSSQVERKVPHLKRSRNQVDRFADYPTNPPAWHLKVYRTVR